MFPADKPTKVTISVKTKGLSGSYKKISKEIFVLECENYFFGMFESCNKVSKTIDNPRIVTKEYLAKVKDWTKSKLLTYLKVE